MPLCILAAAFLAVLFAGPVATPAGAQTADVAGMWEMEWETPRGSQLLTLDFTQDGEELTGTVVMTMRDREVEMEVEGSVEGSAVTFTFEFAPPRGGGGAGRRGGDRPDPVFSFEGTLIEGELRGMLATPRGDPVETVIRRKATE